MRKSYRLRVLAAVILVLGLGYILGPMLFRPNGGERPITPTQQVSQERGPRTDTPAPWTETAPSTVRLIGERKAKEPSGQGDEPRHVIYPKGYVKWHDGGVKWRGDEDVQDPDETDGMTDPRGKAECRTWWSDPPYRGQAP
jgi:hypothetical protein